MTTRTTTILVLLMIAGAAIAGLLLWNQLPDQMASHWNVNDEVDGYMSKPWGVFMMPLVTLGMFVLFLVIPNIDPLKANIAQFREAFNLFIVLIVAFMLYPCADARLESWQHQFQDQQARVLGVVRPVPQGRSGG